MMFTGMPYALRGKKEIEVIKASTEVAGFVRACCLCSWMQPATRDLTTGKLGLDKAKFLVREESRLGLLPHVPPRRACATACRRLGWRSWPSSLGQEACSYAVGAGWLARQAIVSGGRRQVGHLEQMNQFLAGADFHDLHLKNICPGYIAP